MPAKVSQQVLRRLEKNWKSFFEASKAYNANPEKFLARPKLPKYKDKETGRNLLVYTIQAIGKKALAQGWIAPSMTKIRIPVLHSNTCEVRIVPKLNHYVIEVVYEQNEVQHQLNPQWAAAIDVGIDNLAALTSNKPGFVPVLVHGRPLKAINQFYNKRKAELQSILGSNKATSQRIGRLSTKRNFKIDDYLHKASRLIIDQLLANQIGALVIGKNPLWKQKVNLGRATNQKFTAIPHARFVEMLSYKAQLVGIAVLINEESYTSQADFLMLDPIPVYGDEESKVVNFSGKRITTKCYRSGTGQIIHADINGSYNILRKVIPTAFCSGIEGVVVRPVGLKVYKRQA